MREFFKSSLIEFAVIVLVLTLFEGIKINEWRLFKVFSEIFFIVILFRAVSTVTDRIQNTFYILDILIEFFTSLFIVLFFGYIFGWYQINQGWYMCSIGIVVYFINYILGVVGNKKNADYINRQLEKKKKRPSNIKENNSYDNEKEN